MSCGSTWSRRPPWTKRSTRGCSPIRRPRSEEEPGLTIPAGFTLKVHEDGPDTSHLVLPPIAALDESDLEQAAGGMDWSGVAENFQANAEAMMP